MIRIQNVDTIDSPALILDIETVAQNISAAVAMSGDVERLRPHVKTHKTQEVAAMMLGAGIRKFKCATIAEAEMLALAGAPDIMLAYQPTGPKIARLLHLIGQYPQSRFSCLVDNAATVGELASASEALSLKLDLAIDVNVGMNRTGARPEKVSALAEQIAALDSLRLVALHGYDGHIHHPDPEVRRIEADASFALLHGALKSIKAPHEDIKLVAGGTITFPNHIQREQTECSPGTFVFWDEGYRRLMPELPFRCAAFLLSRVVSVVDDKHICIDLGYKSVASEKPLPRVHLIAVPEAKPIAHSEEHLVVETPNSRLYPVGAIIFGIPEHICPTVALYEKLHILSNGMIEKSWKVIARARDLSNS
ncbi:MAG: D-TA family PLP-dependent enzyme [Tannerellaceae bacterium]|jgi:D-serine deaminase-like pyridoxal phosphate-dependent protein|nr:D-TA family PLP-dependent enzyme [Tannerellaceae bacterium]